jgi:hypothetical protein
MSLKTNVLPLQTLKFLESLKITRFVCPECDSIVPEVDFFTSYRLVDGRQPTCYAVKNLCRKCRDSGI